MNLYNQAQALSGGNENHRMQGPNTIAFAPTNPRRVYAGFAVLSCAYHNTPKYCQLPTLGIYRSNDGGRNWQRVSPLGCSSVLALAVSPANPDTVYAVTGGSGVLKSIDGGETWVPANRGLTVLYGRSLAIDPHNSQTLYVGTEGGAVFRSTDGGMRWVSSSAGMDPQAAIRSIVIDPLDPQVIYAADLRTGVYRSSDGTKTWVKINEGLRTRAVRALAISSDGRTLYAATEGEGVFRIDLSPAGG
jgi:photosystem II stability/assembly factor-like uncharacterized protein